MGYLGYDVIREVEHLPDVPADDRNYPDAVMSVIGSLAAFDHWRQRVYLIESVPTLGLSADELDAAYDAAIVRVEQAVADLARPLAYTPVEPPSPDDELPHLHVVDARRVVPAGGRGGQGVRRRRRHLPGGARPAVRPRTRCRSVRRVPGAAPGEPVAVHVLRAPSGVDDRRVVARADGAVARPPGDLAPDRRHAAPRVDRGARPADGRRAERASEGARRARDARRPRPQRRRPGGRSSARSTSTS